MSAEQLSEDTSGDVLEYIASSGWYISLALVGIYFLYKRYESHFHTWRQQSPSTNHEDPAAILSRQEAMEIARQRMQERQDQLSEQHKEKQRELEEKKRQEKIANWEQTQQGGSSGRKLGSSQDEPSSQSIRRKPTSSSDDRLRGTSFNPLMGHGSGTSYRPARRNFSQGG
ncbi:selenoprotein S-like [Ornithodoros turicata]|uniref:selenoprotein S-like n=1 Tax=Ornithodoros turicata TaxID=34597 RepID=UPI00313A3EE4